MKTFLIGSLVLFGSLNAFAYDNCCDRIQTLVLCHDIQASPDQGLAVNVQAGGFAGLTTANVSQVSIAGSENIMSSPVERKEDSVNHPGLIAFASPNLRLVINMNEGTSQIFPAHIKAWVGSHVLNADLFCRFAK